MLRILKKYVDTGLLLIVLLVLMELASYGYNDVAGIWPSVVMLMPYVVAFCVFRAFFILRPSESERLLSIVIAMWLVYESCLGLSQLFGFSWSNNRIYPMTGSFNNPGPYGGFLAVCISICVAKCREYFQSDDKLDAPLGYLMAAASLTGLVVLPSTMSRTAWLALLAAAGIFAYDSFPMVMEFLGRRRNRLAVLCVAIALAVGCVCIKSRSALGRFHIWRMEILAISKSPFVGYGPGQALGAYGNTQAEFFENVAAEDLSARIAGCPEYAFNEYLRFGMECGVMGLLLSAGIVVVSFYVLKKRNSSLRYGILAFGVFCLASYPLSVWQFRLLLAILLAFSADWGLTFFDKGKIKTLAVGCLAMVCVSVGLIFIPDYKKIKSVRDTYSDIRHFSNFMQPEEYADSIAYMHEYMRDDYRFLYDYGYALHNAGKCRESNVILKQGALISSDPMFYDIIGKNYEKMGDYDNARECWLHAHNMVPSRLYPYVLLMEMYDHQGNVGEAKKYAEAAAALPVNEKHSGMVELHDRVEKYLEGK